MKDTELKELIKKEKAYNQGMNEGGDGYNPYTAKIKEEMRRRNRPKTELDKVRARIDYIEYELRCLPMCGNGSPLEPKIIAERKALESELQICKQQKMDILGWTLEATKKRRAEWNARIRAGEITGADGKIDFKKFKIFLDNIGFSQLALDNAIKHYKETGEIQ